MESINNYYTENEFFMGMNNNEGLEINGKKFLNARLCKIKSKNSVENTKEVFFSMTSHALKTPLTNILSSSTLLSKYVGRVNTEEKQRKHIDLIQLSIKQIDSMIHDFMLLEKLLDERINTKDISLNIQEYCEKIISDVQNSSKWIHKIYHYHQGEYFANVDKELLNVVLTRLLSNAIKYSSEYSEIEIRTSIVEKYFVLQIQDQGIGIPKIELHRIFENYYRAENVRAFQGNGLSLCIIKKYLELFNGEISVKSEVNKGTIFTVRIPLSNNKL